MKQIIFTTVVGALVLGISISYALPQSYQVNVHFVPALVTGSCTFGQFWRHPNVTCAMCICLTGSISRCVPQPGCSASTTPTTTSSTTPDPSMTSSTTPGTAANVGSSSVLPDPVPTTPSTAPTTTTAKAPGNGRRFAKFGMSQLASDSIETF